MPQFANIKPNTKLPYLETGKVYTIKRGPDEEEEVTVLAKRKRKSEVVYLLASLTFGVTETTTYGTHEYEALLNSMGITGAPQPAARVDVAEYDEATAD